MIAFQLSCRIIGKTLVNYVLIIQQMTLQKHLHNFCYIWDEAAEIEIHFDTKSTISHEVNRHIKFSRLNLYII